VIRQRSGVHDTPPTPAVPDRHLFTPHADRIDVEQIARPGQWCPRCHSYSRIEFDVLSGGVLIATVQGCPACGSGVYESL
jgi:hypothetical protein